MSGTRAKYLFLSTYSAKAKLEEEKRGLIKRRVALPSQPDANTLSCSLCACTHRFHASAVEVVFELDIVAVAPGRVSLEFEMNERFPVFRSKLNNALRANGKQEQECWLPAVQEYSSRFRHAGVEVLNSGCPIRISHSAHQLITAGLWSSVLKMAGVSQWLSSLVGGRRPSSPVVSPQLTTHEGPNLC
jgi:hypothetical protein